MTSSAIRQRLHSRQVRDCVWPLLAGALAPFGFSPFHWWPLTLASSLLLLIWLQRHAATLKQAFWGGWLYGVGYFGVGTSWVYVSIHQFGAASPLLAGTLTLGFVLGIALFFALQLLLFRLLVPRHSSTWVLLAGFPCAWVLGEWFRSWFLTGFPWIYIGYAPLDTWLAGWAPLTGIYGLSLFCAFTVVCLYLLGHYFFAANRFLTARHAQHNSPAKASLGTPLLSSLLITALVLPWLGGLALQEKSWTQPRDEQRYKVALLQGNTDQNKKWLPEYRRQILQGYSRQTLQHLDADLIIWPETAITRIYQYAVDDLQPLTELLTAREIGLISGVPSAQATDQGTRYHNSIAGLADASGIYHKQRLVPFGEYVPLEAQLRGLIAFFDLPMSSFSLGPAQQPPLRLQGTEDGQRPELTLAPFICYEIVYPDLVAASRADMLLTVSNDSWFGDSIAPHQHLQMARMRALENGRYLLRGTNNGISAVIDPQGRVLARTAQFVETAMTAEVQAYSGQTPFNRFGSWPVLSLVMLTALGLLLYPRLRARS